MPKPKVETKIKGYVYHQNHGKVAWDKAAWEQFLANYKGVKVEDCEANEGTDYLISARGTKTEDWKERNLIAETYGVHPIR